MNTTSAAFIDWLRQYTARISRQVAPEEATKSDEIDAKPRDVGAEPQREKPSEITETLGGVDPARLKTPGHVVVELGLMPSEFVTHLLEEHGGELRQQRFTDYTAWSRSTVSRVLQELEDDGVIVRVQIGREKIVYLPEQAPGRNLFSFPDDTRVAELP